jgi:putative DNA primase/helicase
LCDKRTFKNIVKRYKSASNPNFRRDTLEEIDTLCIGRQLPRVSDNYISVNNGRINLTTGKLEAPDPNEFVVNKIPVLFDPAAKCKAIDRFMYDITIGNGELEALIWEMIGECITPDVAGRVAFFLLGKSGHNGKSTLIQMIQDFLGKENFSNISLKYLNGEFRTVQLRWKLANLCAENGKTAIVDSEIFKAITSGDILNCNVKGKEMVNFEPYATPVFALNAMPKSYDRSAAFYDRILVVPFVNFFPTSSKEIKTKLRQELSTPEAKSYILNRAIAAHIRFGKTGKFTMPAMASEAKREYVEEDDTILQFLNQVDISGMQSKEAYESYINWMKDNDYIFYLGERAFNKEVKEKGWELKKTSIRDNGIIKSTQKWKNLCN